MIMTMNEAELINKLSNVCEQLEEIENKCYKLIWHMLNTIELNNMNMNIHFEEYAIKISNGRIYMRSKYTYNDYVPISEINSLHDISRLAVFVYCYNDKLINYINDNELRNDFIKAVKILSKLFTTINFIFEKELKEIKHVEYHDSANVKIINVIAIKIIGDIIYLCENDNEIMITKYNVDKFNLANINKELTR
jgi:hypothetical protein